MKELLFDKVLNDARLQFPEIDDELRAQDVKNRLLQGIARGFISANPLSNGKANPTAGKAEKARAKAAMEALLGRIPRGFNPRVTEADMLREMSNRSVAEGDKGRPIRGSRSPAHLETLVTKSTAAPGALRKAYGPIGAKLEASVADDDHNIESFVRTALEDIETILNAFGISFFAER